MFAAGALLAVVTYRSYNPPVAALEERPEKSAVSGPLPPTEGHAQSAPAEESPVKEEAGDAQASVAGTVAESEQPPVQASEPVEETRAVRH